MHAEILRVVNVYIHGIYAVSSLVLCAYVASI
jgi:hypothetical protein